MRHGTNVLVVLYVMVRTKDEQTTCARTCEDDEKKSYE